jgi:trimeric autotransporter adhesin
MKILPRIGSLLFLLAQLTLWGFAQHGIIATYVGPSMPVNGAQAATQDIDAPGAVAADGAGGFYVSSLYQHKLYRVAADGSIRLIAGIGSRGFSGDGGRATAAQLSFPTEMAVDSAGNLYISDSLNCRIRKITPAGIISTVAGNGNQGYSGDGGPAAAAQLFFPTGLAVNSAGNLYIADSRNNRIRKITPAGTISTVAGNGNRGYSGDGESATAAKLNHPSGVAVDSAGNLYIADSGNNRIRKVTAGIITTVAGNGTYGYGGDGGQATAATLHEPFGIAIDSAGRIYFSDRWSHRIRKVTPDGVITAVAGNGKELRMGEGGFSGDGAPATEAQLSGPSGVSVDSAGCLYIADMRNKRIRKVTPAGIISTAAGNGGFGLSGDGGPATLAQLYEPQGMAIDSAGNLYIADRRNMRVRKVTPAGIISTVAGGRTGLGDGGLATSAPLFLPSGVAIDSAGNLFIADTYNHRVRKVTPAGLISTVAGTGTEGSSGDGGPAAAAQLYLPIGVAVDSTGNLFIAEVFKSRVRKVTPNGIISTVAGIGTSGYSGDGGPATAAKLCYPSGIAVDSAGNLFIADSNSQRIRKVTPAGIISTVPGTGVPYRGDGCQITAGDQFDPSGISIDSAGNLYFARANQIHKVTPAGILSTMAGSQRERDTIFESGYGDDGRPATEARLWNPRCVAVDSAGNLYISESAMHRIRKVAR